MANNIIEEAKIEELLKKVKRKTIELMTEEEQKEQPKEKEQEEQLEELRKIYEERIKEVKVGEIVKAKVVKKTNDHYLLDIGTKTEGILCKEELKEEKLKEGDTCLVYITKINKEGIFLSKRKADKEIKWLQIDEAYKNDKPIEGKCIKKVKGGFLVNINNTLYGFIPTSHIRLKSINKLNYDDYLNKSFKLKVISFDKKKNKIILSRKLVEEEELKRKEQQLWDDLWEGKKIKAKVIKICNFGAFVEVGAGVQALLPISELAYRQLRHPREVIKKNKEIEVVIIKLDKENKKITVSLKQLLQDPWKEIINKFSEGQIINGKITKIAKKYAFMQIEDEDLEGIIPASELAEKNENDRVKAKIIKIDKTARRIVLSINKAEEQEHKISEEEQVLLKKKDNFITLSNILPMEDLYKKIKNKSKSI